MTALTALWRLAPHRLRLQARRVALALADIEQALRSERRAVAMGGAQLRALRGLRLARGPVGAAASAPQPLQPISTTAASSADGRDSDADRRRAERRARAKQRRLQRARSAAHDWPSEPQGVQRRVRFDASGATLVVDDAKSLLAAGLDAGLELSFSCALGGCGACKCRLRAGEVEMREPNCLGDDERAAGIILPCVARPLSDLELEA
jgi:ferredoxin